ncbi:MAG: hypothetical protein WBC93_05010 [Sulfitobacter sp.]
MAEAFSLKDHLFNAQTIAQLADEYACGIAGFDAARFQRDTLAGFGPQGLLERLDWIADCVTQQLSADFPTMADQLEAAMPARLDPDLTDDDFGQFIHAVPGILAVRHGLEDHRDRALDLIYRATQRFSMEFYIRPFLNRWPDQTLDRMAVWVDDDNYHVRRLVSEGTRPKLPWARAVTLTPDQTLPLLNQLHGDATRYVTRSVSNHLNDLSKTVPDQVLGVLADWKKAGLQTQKELEWMTKHALRTLIKQGHSGAMATLGYAPDAAMKVDLRILPGPVHIGGALAFSCDVVTETALPLLVDYRIVFARPNGSRVEKVFKLKQARTAAQTPMTFNKVHKLKGDATTFTLHPGAHRLVIQINGVDRAEIGFDLE